MSRAFHSIRQNPPTDTSAATIVSLEAWRADRPFDGSILERVDHADEVSRSAHRRTARYKQARDQDSGDQLTRTEDLIYEDPRNVARRIMPQYGLDPKEFDCLGELLTAESSRDRSANPQPLRRVSTKG